MSWTILDQDIWCARSIVGAETKDGEAKRWMVTLSKSVAIVRKAQQQVSRQQRDYGSGASCPGEKHLR